jgi:hypothetical protein
MRTITLALCLTALACSPAAAQQPDYDIKKAAFKVTVDGVQNTKWTYDHKGLGGCDTDANGQGSEKVRFTSSPTKIRAMTMKTLSAPVLSKFKGYGAPVVKLRGKITRQGAMQTADVDTGCGGGVPGGPIPRDCGTKSFRGVKLPLDYRLRAKPEDQLAIEPSFVDDPFKNCPSGGYSFPTLVNQMGDQYMNTELPRGELMDKSIGKIIVVARGRQADKTAESTYETTIKWVLTFKRLGGKRR